MDVDGVATTDDGVPVAGGANWVVVVVGGGVGSTGTDPLSTGWPVASPAADASPSANPLGTVAKAPLMAGESAMDGVDGGDAQSGTTCGAAASGPV
jgi:hypothetical protein